MQTPHIEIVSHVEISRRLALARALARQAGQVLRSHFRRLERYDRKGRFDLVTVADRESEALIRAGVAARFPDDVRIEEEADGKGGAAQKSASLATTPFAWCVDPLDGTTSFVHGYPSFAVSIGLLAYGRPTLGVIYAPYFDELYVGGEGVPATMNDAPIHVSSTAALSDAVIGTGFPYTRASQLDALAATIGRVLGAARDLRRSGSAALDQCHVAIGALDAFYELDLAPWDLAAGEALIRAAGGRVTDFAGAPHDLFGGQTLATNGAIHAALSAVLRGA